MKTTKHIIPLKVKGSSMSPLINKQSLLYVDFDYRGLYKLGDIAIFWIGNKMVAHRVICIRRKTKSKLFLFKGDHNRRCDGWIHENNLFGKVISIKGRNYDIDLHSRKNRAFAIIFTCYSLINFIPIDWLNIKIINSLFLKRVVLSQMKS